jgi:hypothetical protein
MLVAAEISLLDHLVIRHELQLKASHNASIIASIMQTRPTKNANMAAN